MATPDDEQSPDNDPEEGFFDSEGDDRVRGFVPEFVRKMAVAGMGALFMTEEGLRSLAGQLKLPKEALSFILSQAERTKDDLSRVVSEELRHFFQSEKLRDEFLKLLSGMTVEIKAEVRMVPRKDAGEAPEVVLTEISPRRTRKKKE